MDYIKDKIGVYIQKNRKNSKLNKVDVTEVVTLLREVLDKDNSCISDVINVLVELHYAVTSEFFKKNFDRLNDQIKTTFIASFLQSDKINKNANNFGINRNLLIISELLQVEGNDEHLHTILKACSKKACGKDGGQKAGELLFKLCFERSRDKLLLLDYSTWHESDLRNLSIWFEKAIAKNTDVLITDTYNIFVEKYNLRKSKSVEPKNDNFKPIQKNEIEIDNTKVKKEQKEKIFVLVSDLQLEVNKIVNEKVALVKKIEEVEDKLLITSKEKDSLILQLSETHNINDHLNTEIKMKNEQISYGENKIVEIEDRLKNSFSADIIIQNQELISLKLDLIKRLKLDYEDFIKLSSKEPTIQYYEALVGIIGNIFDTLRRKGIVVNA